MADQFGYVLLNEYGNYAIITSKTITTSNGSNVGTFNEVSFTPDINSADIFRVPKIDLVKHFNLKLGTLFMDKLVAVPASAKRKVFLDPNIELSFDID